LRAGARRGAVLRLVAAAGRVARTFDFAAGFGAPSSVGAVAAAVTFAARALAAVRLPCAGLRGRAEEFAAPRAAVRRALERCGRVRGSFVRTPAPFVVSSLVFVSATAHIIA
jgi:hypothetical protein